mgnify:CR=1
MNMEYSNSLNSTCIVNMNEDTTEETRCDDEWCITVIYFMEWTIYQLIMKVNFVILYKKNIIRWIENKNIYGN